MPTNYTQNQGRYIIDNVNQRGCFIVLATDGVYKCTNWEVLNDTFKATVDGLANAGLAITLNADDIDNNPNYVIIDAPGSNDGFENPVVPIGQINGVNDTFTMPYIYDPSSLLVYEDGVLLNSLDPSEIVKLSALQFKVLPPPLSGSSLIAIAKQL